MSIEQIKIDIIKLYDIVKGIQQRLDMIENISTKKEVINKDGIPVGMHIFSEVNDIGEIELVANKRDYEVKRIDEVQIIKGKRFKSLSSAAEAFSRIKRKSGWVFWKDEEGRTLKELFKG